MNLHIRADHLIVGITLNAVSQAEPFEEALDQPAGQQSRPGAAAAASAGFAPHDDAEALGATKPQGGVLSLNVSQILCSEVLIYL